MLGYNSTSNVGDNETPASWGDIEIGAITQLAAGYYHTCALRESGTVRCWGRNNYGQLGYGHTSSVYPASFAGDVSLGGTATQITAGIYHTCALLSTGTVRCWGSSAFGQLGYGNTTSIGDTELPSSVGTVSVGGTVTEIIAGGFHTCALLSTGAVRCWGLGSSGQLGYSSTTTIGDTEVPSTMGTINVGGTVLNLALGEAHTCARMDGDTVRCWGNGGSGRLGYANTRSIGDNEVPATAGNVDVGASALTISAGGSRTCILGSDLRVRCWGEGLYGALGYNGISNVGDNETPASVGAVDAGGDVISVSAGFSHTCAVLSFASTYHVRCWGNGFGGKLGYGNTNHIGDNETPTSAGDVAVE